MAKIDDYDLKNVPGEVVDFVDDVRSILNNGKYQLPILDTSPTWNPDDGETVLVDRDSSTELQFALAGTWNVVEVNVANIEAWLSFSGTGNVAIYDSFNVTGLTKTGSTYLVSWDIDFRDSTYLCVCGIKEQPIGGSLLSLTNTSPNPTAGTATLSGRFHSVSGGWDLDNEVPYGTVMAIGQQ